MATPDVYIVGAGLAGLSCGRQLAARGISFEILEASDGPGGRVRTDVVDGFRLDRGFQVLLTAYPEPQAALDYRALDLRSFEPGARVRVGDRFHTVADPWRRLMDALPSVFNPIGTVRDKMRMARLRSRALAGSLEALFARPETTIREMLESSGFSHSMIDRFFRPFFGGILLDRTLSGSSRMFEFIFRMMALGDTSVPAKGMGEISKRLATGLPVQYGQRVDSLDGLAAARAIVVATEAPATARLVTLPEAPLSKPVSCLYFAAPEPPLPGAWLMLNGESGPINNAAVLSEVAPDYAPPGQALVSVTVLSSQADETAVRGQLVEWYGGAAAQWRHLRTYEIAHAQPLQDRLPATEGVFTPRPGVFVCGDHQLNASIHGAMLSGRRAAEAVVAHLQ
jgi:hypothetical protein